MAENIKLANWYEHKQMYILWRKYDDLDGGQANKLTKPNKHKRIQWEWFLRDFHLSVTELQFTARIAEIAGKFESDSPISEWFN